MDFVQHGPTIGSRLGGGAVMHLERRALLFLSFEDVADAVLGHLQFQLPRAGRVGNVDQHLALPDGPIAQ